MKHIVCLLLLSMLPLWGQFSPKFNPQAAGSRISTDIAWPSVEYASVILTTNRLDVFETTQSYTFTVAGPWPALLVSLCFYSDGQVVTDMRYNSEPFWIGSQAVIGADRGTNAWWILEGPAEGENTLEIDVNQNGFIDYMAMHVILVTNVHQVAILGGAASYSSGVDLVGSSELSVGGETPGLVFDSLHWYRNESDGLTNHWGDQTVIGFSDGDNTVSSKVSWRPVTGNGPPVLMTWTNMNAEITHNVISIRRR
jgi:hypothetical protein